MQVKRMPPMLGLAAILACAIPLTAAAQSGKVRTLGGVSFFEGDPGPVTDTFWTSGQYKYDPEGYMDRGYWDFGVRANTVYGPHDGAANCVFRKRVIIDNWDSRHPHVRVCRRPE